jgi:hypothetical protein
VVSVPEFPVKIPRGDHYSLAHDRASGVLVRLRSNQHEEAMDARSDPPNQHAAAGGIIWYGGV